MTKCFHSSAYPMHTHVKSYHATLRVYVCTEFTHKILLFTLVSGVQCLSEKSGAMACTGIQMRRSKVTATHKQWRRTCQLEIACKTSFKFMYCKIQAARGCTNASTAVWSVRAWNRRCLVPRLSQGAGLLTYIWCLGRVF